MRKKTMLAVSGCNLDRFLSYHHNKRLLPHRSNTHRLDPNHERAGFIMQKLLRREREQDGIRRMSMQRRAEVDQDPGEDESVVEGMDDILALPLGEGLDEQESLQQQLYHVS